MGVVPEAYYQFIMHYAPYFYVIATAMAQDPPAGQKNVTVTDCPKFQVGYPVQIKDDAHNEWNKVAAINGNVLTKVAERKVQTQLLAEERFQQPSPSTFFIRLTLLNSLNPLKRIS